MDRLHFIANIFVAILAAATLLQIALAQSQPRAAVLSSDSLRVVLAARSRGC